MAYKNGNEVWNKIDWTPERIYFLQKNFYQLTNKQLADQLGLKLTSVRTKCYELGLRRMDLEYWTDEQIEFLKDKYKEIGDSELAELFNCFWEKKKGWTKKHIEKKRRYLNLKRTTEENQKIKVRNHEAGRWAMCSTKRWDKTGRSEIGEIKVWKSPTGIPLVVIKTENGFEHYAPWFYKKHIGDIPNGYVVRTKDGNPLNITVENLQLISRAEHARLNSINRNNLQLKKRKAINKLTYQILLNQKKIQDEKQGSRHGRFHVPSIR